MNSEQGRFRESDRSLTPATTGRPPFYPPRSVLVKTMAASLRRGDEPTYLQEKRHALKLAEERIGSIDAELTAARNDRAAILRDVALFNASRAPLARVPLEVFSLIFEQWDDDPFTRNRTLPLVCKTWHDIVWNRATFWTDIVIRPSWEVDKLDVICRFAQLCHQRSKDRPLDVVMDFSAVLPYSVYVGRVLDENAKRFTFIPPQTVPAFAQIATQQHDEPFEEPYSYPYYYIYDQITKGVMKKLMEQNAEHVRRWRSLHITIPTHLDDSAVHLILHELRGTMEGLIEMEIMGRPQNGMSVLHTRPRNLAYFPNLRRLTTNQDVNFDQIRVNYTALTHISLKNSHASTVFIYISLSDFVATTTLELDFVGHTDPLDFDPIDKVLLPQLTYLKLVGPAFRCQAALVQIDAPKLARLHLQQNLTSFLTLEAIRAPLLAQVPTLLVEGKARRIRRRGRLAGTASYEALKAILRQATRLISLRLSEGDWGDAENVKHIVTEVMQEEARPLQRLNEVIIVQCDKNNGDMLTEDREHLTVLAMPTSTVIVPINPTA